MNKKLLLPIAKSTLVTVMLSYAVSAQALFIELWSGDSTDHLRVEDGSAHDLRQATPGEVEYFGGVDNFFVTWSIGQSMPAIGDPNNPELELWSVDISQGSGTLNLLAMDDGFTATDIASWDFTLAGGTSNTLTAAAFIDLNRNEQLDLGEEIGELTGSGWSFYETLLPNDALGPSLPDEYAIGILATVSHDRFFDATYFSASLSGGTDPLHAVPEPSTLTLLGIGLAGIGLFRRRRHSKT